MLLLSVLLSFIPLPVSGSTVSVPISLDYPLLRQLLIKQVFDSPDQAAELLNDPSGCSRIVLSNPRLAEKQPDLQIVADVTARLGIEMLGGCTKLIQWQGNANFIGRPVIQPGSKSLRIEPVDSWLTAADGRRIGSGRIWELAKDRLRPLFSRFRMDLAPSIDALGLLLPEVLPRRSREQLQAIISSLRLSDIQVSPASLDVSLSFLVAELAEQLRSEAALSPEELQQWETRSQMMDALFTFAVKYYASETNLHELRSTLLDILIESRYRLRDALTESATRENDPVRRWFLESWQRLSPVIHRVSLEKAGQEPLLWISLLAATDALYALDRLGPAIGLDVSIDGLRRLARMINENAGDSALQYDESVDPELRRLFLLPSFPVPDHPSGFQLDLWPIRSAWAGRTTERLDRWVPSKEQLPEYLPLIAELLNETTKETLKKNSLKPAVSKLFRELVLATAWQESCWRQYMVKKGRIEPLRSSTGDVGLMQINEKVWRGFFDLQKLRWNIAYNSSAGAEILVGYLVRYALKQGEDRHPGGLDNLARASYSAYNGGPSQISRYRNSGAASAHKKIDVAFWEKYRQVKAGNELNVTRCLSGESADQLLSGLASKAKKKSGTPQGAGDNWLQAQDSNFFTLQLGVFSNKQSARKYIEQVSLSGQARVLSVHRDGATKFLVIHGSYETRDVADRAKQRLAHLKPWVRRFGDLRKTR